jgi:hypothetical protein
LSALSAQSTGFAPLQRLLAKVRMNGSFVDHQLIQPSVEASSNGSKIGTKFEDVRI